MREVIAVIGQEIALGRYGEHLAVCVRFDISEWVNTYGEGVAHLLHRRNGDSVPYPCDIEQDGGVVTWAITQSDVYVAGNGLAELQYFVNDALVKSETFVTVTERSLYRSGEEAPEPYKAWMDNMLKAASDAVESAGDAEASAKAAEADANAAIEAAQQAREDALNVREAVEGAVSNAVEIAEDKAEQAAKSAKQAESAHKKAVNALNDANESAEAAEAAEQRAKEAQAAAEKARNEARAIAGGDFVTHEELNAESARIEELAMDVAGGVEVQLEDSHTYLDGKIDSESTRLDAKIDTESATLNDKIDTECTRLDNRMTDMYAEFEDINASVYNKLNQRVDSECETLNDKIDTARNTLNDKIDTECGFLNDEITQNLPSNYKEQYKGWDVCYIPGVDMDGNPAEYVVAGHAQSFLNKANDTKSNVSDFLPSDIAKTVELSKFTPLPIRALNVTAVCDRHGSYVSCMNPIKGDAVVGFSFRVFDPTVSASSSNAVIDSTVRFCLSGAVEKPPEKPTKAYNADAGAEITSIAQSYITARENGRKFAYGENVFYTTGEYPINRPADAASRAGAAVMECDTYVGMVLRGISYENSPFADTTPGLMVSYDQIMTEYTHSTSEWCNTIRGLLTGDLAQNVFGRDIRFDCEMAWLAWSMEGAVFSDVAHAMPGDVCFWKRPKNERSFDNIGHVGIVGERAGDDIYIYEFTGWNGTPVKYQYVHKYLMRDKEEQPAYFARLY